MNIPPASKTRYFDPGVKGTKPEEQPFIVFNGRWRQHKEAASGSSAISKFSLVKPACENVPRHMDNMKKTPLSIK